MAADTRPLRSGTDPNPAHAGRRVGNPVGCLAVVASTVERISARLFRLRHLPLAGGKALHRVGSAGLLQPVPVAVAPDAHHLAGDRRAGVADRAYVAPRAPNAGSRR